MNVRIALVSEPLSTANSLLERARSAFRAKDLETSRIAFLAALSGGSDERTCRLHLGRICNSLKDWHDALAHWTWLRDRDPQQLEPHLQVGRAHYRLGNAAEAVQSFRQVLVISPGHAEARQRLKQLEHSAGERKPTTLEFAKEAFAAADYQGSKQALHQALAEGADEAACRLHLGRIYNLERDWLGSLENWQWLRDRDPQALEPHLQVARALYRLDRLSDAARAYVKVLHIDGASEEARERLVRLARTRSEVAKKVALQAFRGLVAQDGAGADNHFRLAQTLAAVGQHSEASSAFRQAINLDSRNADFHLGLGKCLRVLRQVRDAADVLARAVDLRSDDWRNHYELGCALAELGRHDQALSALRRAAVLDGHSAAIHLDIARSLRATGESLKALETIGRALELAPGNIAARHELGILYALLGQEGRAVEAFAAVVAANPKFGDAYSRMGACLQVLHRTAEAVEAFSKAARYLPRNARVQHRLGKALLENGKKEEGIAALRRAAALDSEDKEIEADLARVLSRRVTKSVTPQALPAVTNGLTDLKCGQELAAAGQHQEAVVAFRKALKVQADLAEAWTALAKSLLVLHQPEQAVEELKRGVSLNSKRASIHLELGRALERLGRREEALAPMRRAVELSPAPSSLRSLGALCFNLGKDREAREAFAAAAKRNRNLVSASYLLGLAHRAAGHTAEAIACFLQAAEDAPNEVQPLASLGQVYQQERRIEDAFAAFERAVSLNPEFIPAQYGFGVASRRRGDIQGAASAFLRVVERDPRHEGSLLQLGEIADLAGDRLGALKYAKTAVAARPNSVAALMLRARIQFSLGSNDAALIDLNEVLRLERGHPRAELYQSLIRRLGGAGEAAKTVALCVLRPVALAEKSMIEELQGSGVSIVALTGPDSGAFADMPGVHFVSGKWRDALASITSDWVLVSSDDLPPPDLVDRIRARAGLGIGVVSEARDRIAASPSLFLTAPLKAYLDMEAAAGWQEFANSLASKLRFRSIEIEAQAQANTSVVPGNRGPLQTVWLVTPHGKNRFGGGEQFLRTLAPIYRSLGYEPVIVGLLDRVDPEDLEGSVDGLNYLHFPKSISVLRRAALDKRTPAIVHVLSGLGYEVAEALQGLATTLIYGTHFWRDMFHGPFDDVDRAGRPRGEFASLLPAFDQSYANSAFTRSMIERHFAVSHPIVYSLPHDLPESEATYGTGRYALLMSAAPDKGFTLVLNLAARLPSMPFRVVASQAPRAKVEADVEAAGVDNIDIVDWTGDTSSLYRDARVVLVPSYGVAETFSRVIVEAHRFGVPVVGCDRGNIPLLLSVSGLALPDDETAWADELDRLFMDDDYHAKRARAARENSERYLFSDQPVRVARLVRAATRRVAVAVGAGIGNMIQCSPAIRRLAEHLDHPVDVVLNSDFPGAECLFAGAPWVGSVFGNRADMSDRRFDIVYLFDSFGGLIPSFNTNQLVVSRRTFSFSMTQTVHESEYNLLAMRQLLGVPYEAGDAAKYFLGDFERVSIVPGRVGFHGGSKGGTWMAKRWPYFEALGEELKNRGFEVLSFGTPDELVPGTLDATGTPLRETFVNMAHCDYFIANDSGLMHAADALGIPLATFFAPTSIVKNGPLAATSQVIGLQKSCAPCQFDPDKLATCRCIGEITLEYATDRVLQHMSTTTLYHEEE